jgi:hypothetical protein
MAADLHRNKQIDAGRSVDGNGSAIICPFLRLSVAGHGAEGTRRGAERARRAGDPKRADQTRRSRVRSTLDPLRAKLVT